MWLSVNCTGVVVHLSREGRRCPPNNNNSSGYRRAAPMCRVRVSYDGEGVLGTEK